MNFQNYLGGFSDNVVEIIENFQLEKPVEKLNKNNRLFILIDKFTEIDFHPDKISNRDMGLIFEELLRKFSEMSNETSGEHYTPRDVVRLLVSLVFSEDKDDLQGEGKVRSIFDPCCGTGGMLTIGKEYVHQNINDKVRLRLLGQELNPQTYSICKSDMLITDEDPDNIRLGSSLSEDNFQGQRFDYMITNPPFGVSWKSEKEFIENESSNSMGRFSNGLPWVKDGQLLFLLNMISKMELKGSRIGMITNGSPLTTDGRSIEGESKIRNFLVENDLIETIVLLPDDLFFNTGILTYFWIISNKKSNKRKGKIQLINGLKCYSDLFKPIGDKRKLIEEKHRDYILDKYIKFQNEKDSLIFPNEFFQYKLIRIYYPLFEENGNIIRDKKGNPKKDNSRTDKVKINVEESVSEFFQKYLKENPNCWYEEDETTIGCEFHITKYFFTPEKVTPIKEIKDEIINLRKSVVDIITSEDVLSEKGGNQTFNHTNHWFGKIPNHWEIQTIDSQFIQRKNKVSVSDYPPLSVTKKGVVRQLDFVSKSTDTENRKLVLKNDFVINSRSDRRGSSGVSDYDGSVSSIYIVIYSKTLSPQYIHFLFRSKDFQEEFYRNGKGIVDDLWTTDYDEMRKIKIPVPPFDEQINISKRLHKVQSYLRLQSDLLDKYSSFEQSVISETVLGKINLKS